MSDELSRLLGYQFKNPHLLKLSLTHRSTQDENNERLEFLGDAVVSFLIGEALYHQYPHAQEGELSRWRASLVNREALGDLARQFELGRYLILGQGEMKSGGAERTSILSCTIEAIIGAIYLDGGFTAAKECILRWYQPYLNTLTSAASHKDPKTLLQEYLQSQRMSLPVYAVQTIEGEAHKQLFIVTCTVEDKQVTGKGSSRRRAEQEAAEAMIKVIKK